MQCIEFTKMQGLGNDFIVIDELRSTFLDRLWVDGSFAQRICDRRFGVGADQILWLKQPHGKGPDARMEILNADGSQAEMCGNGIRAVAIYLNRHHFQDRLQFEIETLAGLKLVQLRGQKVTVDMGAPTLGGGFPQGESLEVMGQSLTFFEVNMGNPHAVFFEGPNLSALRLEELGPQIETHLRFPNRTNVEWVTVENSHRISVRVWERGAGITLACGTGACAAAVAALATARVKTPLEVVLPGGTLQIHWQGGSSSVQMEGPAQEVFRGQFELPASG
ncbi:MAG: diaminopimelate epimerase [Bdellovibrionia bacterium]